MESGLMDKTKSPSLCWAGDALAFLGGKTGPGRGGAVAWKKFYAKKELKASLNQPNHIPNTWQRLPASGLICRKQQQRSDSLREPSRESNHTNIALFPRSFPAFAPQVQTLGQIQAPKFIYLSAERMPEYVSQHRLAQSVQASLHSWLTPLSAMPREMSTQESSQSQVLRQSRFSATLR